MLADIRKAEDVFAAKKMNNSNV